MLDDVGPRQEAAHPPRERRKRDSVLQAGIRQAYRRRSIFSQALGQAEFSAAGLDLGTAGAADGEPESNVWNANVEELHDAVVREPRCAERPKTPSSACLVPGAGATAQEEESLSITKSSASCVAASSPAPLLLQTQMAMGAQVVVDMGLVRAKLIGPDGAARTPDGTVTRGRPSLEQHDVPFSKADSRLDGAALLSCGGSVVESYTRLREEEGAETDFVKASQQ
eukprot:gene19090-22824_t